MGVRRVGLEWEEWIVFGKVGWEVEKGCQTL